MQTVGSLFFIMNLFYSLSTDGCDSLKLLTIAAISANTLPVIKHTSVLLLPTTQLNRRATRVVPKVCPINRAMPNIPLAPPERFVGAEAIIVLLLGVWKSPKPMPQTANRRQILRMDDSVSNVESE